jgi:hypothetical protein
VARRGLLPKLLMFAMLEFGALAGVPMRASDVEEMTRILRDSAIVCIVPREDDDAGDPPVAGTGSGAPGSLDRPPPG